MIYEEIIQIIKRWIEEDKKEAEKCLKEEKYAAQNYYIGKFQAYKNVIILLRTSDQINIPWEE